MISDNDVILLYKHAHVLRDKHGFLDQDIIEPQFFRGQADYGWDDAHPGGCGRHLKIFNNFSAIPKYCFDCYKVLISPRNIIELFKLMIVYTKVELPDDNCRKALVEMRPNMSGVYKGIITCRSHEEATIIAKIMRDVLSEKISTGIPVIIKRGCSEYAQAYPEYANIGDSPNKMVYKPEWQQVEDAADEHFTYGSTPDREMYNHPNYTIKDANIMYYWLQYASAIGDMNYMKISGLEIKPLADADRPAVDIPVEESQVQLTKKMGRNDPCVCGSGKKYKRCCMLN